MAAISPAALCGHRLQQQRNLSIHEHLSMGLLKDAGVAVPRFKVASTPDEAFKYASEIGKISTVLWLMGCNAYFALILHIVLCYSYLWFVWLIGCDG